MRNFVAASHRLRTVGNAIHAGDPAGTGRSTDGSIVEAVLVKKSFGGKLINVRSPGIGATVRTHPGDTIVLAGNPENVGPFRSAGRSGK